LADSFVFKLSIRGHDYEAAVRLNYNYFRDYDPGSNSIYR
jgi:hypothetical protein